MIGWQDWLNTREWAALTWLAVALAVIIAQPGLRASLLDVVKALFEPLILLALALAVGFIGVIVRLMAEFGLWRVDNLKTTIIWTVTFAFLTMFSMDRVTADKTFYGRTLRETIAFTVLLLFIAEFYTFDYWIELILLPTLFAVQLLHEISKRDPAHRPAERLFGCLLGLSGLAYVGYGLYRTFQAPAAFFTAGTIRDYLVPIVLSCLFLPFIYLFGIYMTYERVFGVMIFPFPDAGLRRYAKWKALLHFRTDLDFLDRWRKTVMSDQPADRAAVRRSIAEMRTIRSREAAPAPVGSSRGWQPQATTQFLGGEGLRTRDYHRQDDLWSASASLLEIGEGDGIRRNNLGYYISGNELAATRLSLCLNVNVTADAEHGEAEFIRRAIVLIEEALGPGTLERLRARIKALQPFSAEVSNGHVALTRDMWTHSAITGGYSLWLKLSREPDEPEAAAG